MSDYIPFEIQSEIIKMLPVKSLVQFRSVSKQWKSFIDCPEFIKTYHIRHPNPQHHLLLQYKQAGTYTFPQQKYSKADTFTSIIDDNTFPHQKSPLTPPDPLTLIRYPNLIGSVDGLLCFYGRYQDTHIKSNMVLLWNPCIRKSVGIHIPNVFDIYGVFSYTRMGFGVCRDTNDPMLVKINVVEYPSISWEVQVFTLSSRLWKTVYTGTPFNLGRLDWNHVFIDGIIYWYAHPSFVISFDLKSEKFVEVFLSERLIRAGDLKLVKVNGSLGLLEYYGEGGMTVCGVWMRKDDINQPFRKMYTVKVEGKSVFMSVLGFRNSGEVVLQLVDDDDINVSRIEVYEPSSGRTNSVGISGKRLQFSASSYMETLLLLDQSNSIIQSQRRWFARC